MFNQSLGTRFLKKHQIRSRFYKNHHHHYLEMAKCMPFEMEFYLRRNISGEKNKTTFL